MFHVGQRHQAPIVPGIGARLSHLRIAGPFECAGNASLYRIEQAASNLCFPTIANIQQGLLKVNSMVPRVGRLDSAGGQWLAF
jgi:hypothetical protein